MAAARAITQRGQVRLISVNTIGIGLEEGSKAEIQIKDIAEATVLGSSPFILIIVFSN